MQHDEFAMEVFGAICQILEETVTPERVRNTVRHLDVGNDILLPSSAEVTVSLVWEDLMDWLKEDPSALKDYPLRLVEGLCGAQTHTWITCSTTKHNEALDPVSPVVLIDVVPPGVIPPDPIMLGPGSPLRLAYKQRKVLREGAAT